MVVAAEMSRRITGKFHALFSALLFQRAAVLLGIMMVSTRIHGLELTNAIVVSSAHPSVAKSNAVRMLIEEVEKRTRVRWTLMTSWPVSNAPVIFVGTKAELEQMERAHRERFRAAANVSLPEGYQISLAPGLPGQTNPAVFVVGNDARGILFGVGRLLRELRLQRHRIDLDEKLNIAASPKYALRGHQLGFRPKCNSYDAWTCRFGNSISVTLPSSLQCHRINSTTLR
jgi:hypothetical protein